jgi:hypothetical protein
MSAVGWDDEGYKRRLEQLKEVRRLVLREQEEQRMKLIDQLVKFKVCPCVAQGRYSTCCQPRNDRK